MDNIIVVVAMSKTSYSESDLWLIIFLLLLYICSMPEKLLTHNVEGPSFGKINLKVTIIS